MLQTNRAGSVTNGVQGRRQYTRYPGRHRDDAQTAREVCLQPAAIARREVSPARRMSAAQHICYFLVPAPELRPNTDFFREEVGLPPFRLSPLPRSSPREPPSALVTISPAASMATTATSSGAATISAPRLPAADTASRPSCVRLPWPCSPRSFLRLPWPHTGHAKEQWSSAMTMTTWPSGSLGLGPMGCRARSVQQI